MRREDILKVLKIKDLIERFRGEVAELDSTLYDLAEQDMPGKFEVGFLCEKMRRVIRVYEAEILHEFSNLLLEHIDDE